MIVDGKPVLHSVGEATLFSAAQLVRDPFVKSIWATILACLAMIYTTLRNCMLVDEGSYVRNALANIGRFANGEDQSTGKEANLSVRLGEGYLQALPSTYRKTMKQHPETEPRSTLVVSVKAINDSSGPEGLVPSALLFGEFQEAHSLRGTTQRETLGQRVTMASCASKQMQKDLCEKRLLRALQFKNLSGLEQVSQPGGNALVWRQKISNYRIGEWLGPFAVLTVDESRKQGHFQDSENSAARPFNVVHVECYHDPGFFAHCSVIDLEKKLRRFRTVSFEEKEVSLTKVVGRSDPEAYSDKMIAVKREKIPNLLKRGTFKVVLK